MLALSAAGDVTYTFQFSGTSAEENQVRASVAAAAELYNRHGSFNKHWNVYYNSGIPTAEANYNGYMGYGGQRTIRVALHEGGHTMGMGTTAAYANLISGGVWKGIHARETALEMASPYADGLRGDGHAIWPWGMNFENEDGVLERVKHVRIMAAMRCDMGIMAYNREARNELVHPSDTARFAVKSPLASSYQWFRNGVALTNGGDISGATSPSLEIANADPTDEGSYHCAATGAGETLNSRARNLWVDPAEALGQWDMNGTVTDSAKTNHGTAIGNPAYTAGKIGQAIDLDGIDDYVSLPSAALRAKDLTIATWVRWDGGNNWQRIFDFGTGTFQHIFLTPRSGGGTMRLVLKDAVNGTDAETRIDTAALPTGQWVHVAAVLKGDIATLYVNGRPVGSNFNTTINPIDFLPTQNYIGKSQYPDPLFNGRVDDFRIYNHALGGAEIWDLGGDSANAAPTFTSDPVEPPDAVASLAYTGVSLADFATDANFETLTFAKLTGPAWLTVAADGTLSGVPSFQDSGENLFLVRVTDPSGATSDAELRIHVIAPPSNGPIAYWDFNEVGAADGAFVPGNGDRADLDGDGAMDADDFRIGATDLSGNGNHLTAWTSSWMKWTSDSQQGDFGMTADNSFPAANTDSTYNPGLSGVDVEAIIPTSWTIEVLFKSTDLSGNRTLVGRDGRDVGGVTSSAAALYFSTRGTDLAIQYTDVEGALHNLQVAAGLQQGVWYRAAATSDGSTLRLYLNGIQIGSLDLTTTGTDTALAPGYGTWAIARGMWAGGHADRFFGVIDAVAISDVRLAPGTFVTEIFGSDDLGFHFYMAGHGHPGAAFGDDLNRNGLTNAVEYFLGLDPTTPGPAPVWLTTSADFREVTFPYNPFATGITGRVEHSTNLLGWSDAGVSYTSDPATGERQATLDVPDGDQLFLRLSVE